MQEQSDKQPTPYYNISVLLYEKTRETTFPPRGAVLLSPGCHKTLTIIGGWCRIVSMRFSGNSLLVSSSELHLGQPYLSALWKLVSPSPTAWFSAARTNGEWWMRITCSSKLFTAPWSTEKTMQGIYFWQTAWHVDGCDRQRRRPWLQFWQTPCKLTPVRLQSMPPCRPSPGMYTRSFKLSSFVCSFFPLHSHSFSLPLSFY